MRVAASLVFILLLAGSGGALAVAGAPGDTEPLSVEQLVASLGTPVRADGLERVLAELRPIEPETGCRLARALGRCGGHVSMEGLRELLGHYDDRVREITLRAVGQVGLRAEHVVALARRSLEAYSLDERCAAIYALGRVGDARDVPHLLALIETPDTNAAETKCAYAALRRIGGMSIPDVAARWQAWWMRVSVRGRADLYDSLGAMADCDCQGPRGCLCSLSKIVGQLGWLDLPLVRDQVREWLVQVDPHRRREGCRIVSALRLAEFADDVRWARERDVLGICGDAADEALRVLGVAVTP